MKLLHRATTAVEVLKVVARRQALAARIQALQARAAREQAETVKSTATHQPLSPHVQGASPGRTPALVGQPGSPATLLGVGTPERLLDMGRVILAEEPKPEPSHHTRAQDQAAKRYREAVKRYLAIAEADSLRHKKVKESVKVWILLMDHEQQEAFGDAYGTLVPGMPTVDPTNPPTEQEAQAFAAKRAPLIADWAKRTREALDQVPERTPGALRKVARTIIDGEGERLAENEGVATYADAQLRLLDMAGYETKAWRAVGDDRTCPDCMAAESEGEQPLDYTFPSTGTVSPPAHPWCRCWIIGQQRKPQEVTASEQGQRRAKPGGEYGANGEWYEGGKWIANSDEAKRHKPPYKPTRRQEVEPRKWEAAEEGKNSIYPRLAGMELYDQSTGTFSLNPNLQDFYATEAAIENRKKLIALYNAGHRWTDLPAKQPKSQEATP